MGSVRSSDQDVDGDGAVRFGERVSWLRKLWRAAPRTVRRVIVSTVGGTLVALGCALVVLPGPFTSSLLVAGFAVLATEFVWAASALDRARSVVSRATAAVKTRRGRRNETTDGSVGGCSCCQLSSTRVTVRGCVRVLCVLALFQSCVYCCWFAGSATSSR